MVVGAQRHDGWDEKGPKDPRGLDETPAWFDKPYRLYEGRRIVYVAEPRQISDQDIVALGRLGADGWDVVIVPADSADRVRVRICRSDEVVFRRPGRPDDCLPLTQDEAGNLSKILFGIFGEGERGREIATMIEARIVGTEEGPIQLLDDHRIMLEALDKGLPHCSERWLELVNALRRQSGQPEYRPSGDD
jgi:hypothetical protein